MTVDIFIKTYRDDFWLLHLALKTIAKNVKGYKNLIILVPEVDKHLFDTRDLPPRTFIHYITEYGNGYLWQQWAKINAHNYCYADYILYSDSDVFYDHFINVKDIIKNNKPEILYTDYEKLPDAIIWKAPTSLLLGEEVKYEFMRRLPLLYHRSTLVNLNKWKPDLEKVIMESHMFSEFNLIGSWAYKYEREKYRWQNTDDWEFVPPHGNQVWSKGSKDKGSDELHLREYIRTLETLLKSFGIIVPN